jgi:hypothetical protein
VYDEKIQGLTAFEAINPFYPDIAIASRVYLTPGDLHVIALTLWTDWCRSSGLEGLLAVLTFPLHFYTSGWAKTLIRLKTSAIL